MRIPTEVTKTSPLSGKRNTRTIDITIPELQRWWDGELIQSVAPHLSADDREFLMTGITPEEWEAVFGTDD
jgi:hypothetical protein